ncbi:prepilin-type N-terminal cleavage/methylation domain-containing protein [uncultured Ilyobacter sp.]|uniref:type II secretion system protein n=1 Tax=uncultured Ilyobacter sp. TaxID=544433 RepID=UPI0029C0ED3A|nr:prepilin-type N-terminal cleavage/methylation domain-containing protein [uncultured Ilyobacter sp.]
MKKGFTILELIIVLGALALFFVMAVPRLSDVRDSTKAARVQKDLVGMRIALENFYTATGEYPDLISEGAKDDLKLVKKESTEGKKVNFAQFLERDSIPETPKSGLIEESNLVIDWDDLEQEGIGGWKYNYIGKTGEIHANLPDNMYNQLIRWSEE